MNFTDEEAERIWASMRRNFDSSDWRSKNLAVPTGASSWQERNAFEEEASASLDGIGAMLRPTTGRDRGALAERMRAWIDMYVTPAGWRRYQDAERQRRSKQSRGSTQMAIDRETSTLLSRLAKEVGLDKRATLARLLEHLTYKSEAGLEARHQFAEAVRSQQFVTGAEMLAAAFGLDLTQVLHVFWERKPEDPALKDLGSMDWALLAIQVGPVALRELAASAAQGADPLVRLRAALPCLRQWLPRSANLSS